MARGAAIGAGAATVEDVTGDAQGPAPGKLDSKNKSARVQKAQEYNLSTITI